MVQNKNSDKYSKDLSPVTKTALRIFLTNKVIIEDWEFGIGYCPMAKQKKPIPLTLTQFWRQTML